ncbi:MAG: shikimate dehydrogenase [Alphaproteobacteria bacterium]|nr:shikimate dehydrogenase [Alphaproteobacteria bacterium]
MRLTGHAKVAGVIGWPIGHSRSPTLHGFWLERYDIDGAFVPLPVRPEHLAEAIRALPRLGFQGANVTVPHKVAALDVVDRVEDAAGRIGAVNTLVVAPDGTIEGRNTDGFGFLQSLIDDVPEFDAAGDPAVLLGAGGAARAVIVALLDAGAPEIRIVNRTPARAEALAAEFGPRCHALPWPPKEAALREAALLVNSTSLGMTGQPPLAVDLDGLPAGAIVTDLVYDPLDTDLLQLARSRGNPIVDGLGMLLHQARPGFAAWFGVEPDVTPELRAAVLETLRS